MVQMICRGHLVVPMVSSLICTPSHDRKPSYISEGAHARRVLARLAFQDFLAGILGRIPYSDSCLCRGKISRSPPRGLGSIEIRLVDSSFRRLGLLDFDIAPTTGGCWSLGCHAGKGLGRIWEEIVCQAHGKDGESISPRSTPSSVPRWHRSLSMTHILEVEEPTMLTMLTGPRSLPPPRMERSHVRVLP